ncbi:MAG: nucleotidyltransferase domain-containing protein [Candidatus Nanohaloarchaea archaeon]
MASKQRKAFEEFVERAEEELGESLEKLVLYGSVARGEENEGSDVDVFAVVKEKSDKEVLEELAFDVNVEFGVFMVPVVKTVEEFESVRDSIFVREVEKTGEAYV